MHVLAVNCGEAPLESERRISALGTRLEAFVIPSNEEIETATVRM